LALALEPGGDWRWMFALSAIPGVILAVALRFVPFSPRWLVERGRVDEAYAVLVHLRGPEADVEVEISGIRAAADHPTASWRELLSPGIRIALIVGVGLAVLQQATGINAVLYYAPTIFQSAGLESESSAIMAGAGLGVVNVIFTIVAIRYIDRLGRRTLCWRAAPGWSSASSPSGWRSRCRTRARGPSRSSRSPARPSTWPRSRSASAPSSGS
jgi:MFS family permease